jgi:hypothetical protein
VFTRSSLVAIMATFLAWLLFFGVGWGREKLDQADQTQKQLAAKVAEKQNADPAEAPTEKPKSFWTPPRALDVSVRTLHAVLPRVYDLDSHMVAVLSKAILPPKPKPVEPPTSLESAQLADVPPPPLPETLGVTVGFIGVMLTISCWRLRRRDG